MKRYFGWTTYLVLVLIAFSLLFYLINYFIFRDWAAEVRLLTQQLAFTPIQVILITLILNQALVRREKRNRMEKLNMVIGAFFSEVGTTLLKSFSAFNTQREALSKKLIVTSRWSDRDFAEASKYFKEYEFDIQLHIERLGELRTLLVEERPFFLGLLENPNLFEHESFTNLLWATTHLAEELSHRDDLSKLPASDLTHLTGDTKRAYCLLVSQWIAYMQHLKNSYPYLFSLAVRTNPLDPNASVEVREV